MITFEWMFVACDECNGESWARFQCPPGAKSITEARKMSALEQEGWRYDELKNHDICPSCMEGEQ